MADVPASKRWRMYRRPINSCTIRLQVFPPDFPPAESIAMRSCLIVLSCLLTFVDRGLAQSSGNVDWPRVGNDPGCMRYSELTQVNRQNVARLKPAWTFHTGELKGRAGKTIECTPIVIDGVMYVTTGYLRVVALEAATGKE